MKNMHRANALVIGLFISSQLCGSSFPDPRTTIFGRDKNTLQWQYAVWLAGLSVLTYLGYQAMATGKITTTPKPNADRLTLSTITPTTTPLESGDSNTKKTLDEYPPHKETPDLYQEKTPPTAIKATERTLFPRVPVEMDTPKTLGEVLPDKKTYWVEIMLLDNENSISSRFEAIIGNKTTIDDIEKSIVSSEPKLKGKIFLRNNKPMTMESITKDIIEYEKSVALQKAAADAGYGIEESAEANDDDFPGIFFESSILQQPQKTEQEEQEELCQQMLQGSKKLYCLTFFDAVMEQPKTELF